MACLAEVLERVVDGAFFWFTLMRVEIGLQLRFSFDGIGYELPVGTERQFADIAIGGAGSAADESCDSEFAVRHRAIMAGGAGGVKCPVVAAGKSRSS